MVVSVYPLLILTWQDVVISSLLPVAGVACYKTGHRLVPPNIHLHGIELVEEKEQENQAQEDQEHADQ